MKAIGIIYGRNAAASNGNTNHKHLVEALEESGAVVHEAYDQQQHKKRDDQHTVISALCKADGPTLIFGILNGRGRYPASAQLAPSPQPQFVNGHDGKGLRPLLETIAGRNAANPHPVDIFLLTASKPDFIHAYAKRLPHGSTIIAVQTPPTSADHRDFWDLVDGPEIHGLVAPSARRLLTYYLASNGPMVRAPQIAVSGHRQRGLHDLWEQFIYTEQISSGARDLFNTLRPHMTHQTILRTIAARQDIQLQEDFTKPVNPAYYAWAIESIWDKVYPQQATLTAATAASPIQARQAATSATAAAQPAEEAPAAPAARGRRRPSQSEIASLYRPGKPAHLQDPRVIKRILRQG